MIQSSNMEIEVVHLSKHGVWLSVAGEELFLSFRVYPWFQKAPVGSIFNVQLLEGRHLRWPDLDVNVQLQQLPSSSEKIPLPSGPVN